MKKSAFLASALMSLSFAANAAVDFKEIQFLADEISQGAGDDGFVSSYDLAGRELINGSWDTSIATNVFDDERNVSAMITECLAVVVADKSLPKANWSYTVAGPCDSATITGGNAVGSSVLEWYGYISSTYYGQPTANASLITLKAQFSFAAAVGAFDPADKSLNVTLANTNWADIHYKINGGSQLNYRMTKAGDDYKQIVFQALQNGDVIDFYTTSEVIGSGVVTSAWESVMVDGIPDLLTTSYSAGTFSVGASSSLEWIDIHYTINGSSQYNYRMSGAGTSFSFTVPQQLYAGDVISYWYTYSLNGSASDTVADSVTH